MPDKVWQNIKWMVKEVRAGLNMCRVCRVYLLGWRTVGLRLPGKRLVLLHFYTRNWVLSPSRLERVWKEARNLAERQGLKIAKIIVVARLRFLSSGARRFAQRFGIVFALSINTLKSLIMDAIYSAASWLSWRIGVVASTVAMTAYGIVPVSVEEYGPLPLGYRSE